MALPATAMPNAAMHNLRDMEAFMNSLALFIIVPGSLPPDHDQVATLDHTHAPYRKR
jgi:hypothetical protein